MNELESSLFFIASAGLGFVIGWFLHRILSLKELARLVREHESQTQHLVTQNSRFETENSTLAKQVSELEKKLSVADESSKRATAETREFSTTLAQRDRRIKELEIQAYSAEEQNMQLQRDLAKVRLARTRDAEHARGVPASGRAGGSTQQASGSGVPVLNKRADVSTHAAESHPKPAEQTMLGEALPDITNQEIESDLDVMDMTSEFDFDPAELLDDSR